MKLTLTEKRQETSDVISFIFTPKQPLVWKAGQYLHYVLHHEPTDDRGSDRWFTNSAAPFENQVRITTRLTINKGSSFKKKIAVLEIGKDIEISNVEGDGHFIVDDIGQNSVFIAGGIGVTPFRSILTQLDHERKPIHVTLLYANRDQQVVYKEELEALAGRNSHFKIHYIYSPEHIDEPKIKELIPDIKKSIFYISGPEPMVDSLGATLKQMGIPDAHIKQDSFPGYPAE
jgi:ferredoxin-NADP reductase